MTTIKKTIFLSNKNNTNFKGMATLTLEKKNQNIFATIRTFNLESKENYILAIKQDEKIHKQNVILNNNKYSFIMPPLNNSLDNIGCVLFIDHNQSYTPIIYGSDCNSNYKNQIINNLKENINKIKNNTITQNVTYEKITNETKPLMQEDIPLSSTPTQSAHNFYKENFTKDIKANTFESNYYGEENVITPYHNEVAVASNFATLFDSSEEEIEETINKELDKENNNHKFYNMIAEQLDDLFKKYPSEQNLEKLIDNSKWVKIKNSDNNYYVVGIIYKYDDIKYICYGVPGNFNKEPPIELKEYSQWLPTDISNPYDNGYWVMYQDADTGENVITN